VLAKRFVHAKLAHWWNRNSSYADADAFHAWLNQIV
jgi:hypothetical protein